LQKITVKGKQKYVLSYYIATNTRHGSLWNNHSGQKEIHY